MPPALAAVVAHPVEVDDKGRGRVGADHDLEGLARPHAGSGAVAFDPWAAVLRGRVDARVRQQPVARAGLLVLPAYEVARRDREGAPGQRAQRSTEARARGVF